MSAGLKNLSIEELKKIDKLKTQELRNKYNQYKENQEQIRKLIESIRKKESLIKKIPLISKSPPKRKPKFTISKPKNKQKYKPKNKQDSNPPRSVHGSANPFFKISVPC